MGLLKPKSALANDRHRIYEDRDDRPTFRQNASNKYHETAARASASNHAEDIVLRVLLPTPMDTNSSHRYQFFLQEEMGGAWAHNSMYLDHDMLWHPNEFKEELLRKFPYTKNLYVHFILPHSKDGKVDTRTAVENIRDVLNMIFSVHRGIRYGFRLKANKVKPSDDKKAWNNLLRNYKRPEDSPKDAIFEMFRRVANGRHLDIDEDYE